MVMKKRVYDLGCGPGDSISMHDINAAIREARDATDHSVSEQLFHSCDERFRGPGFPVGGGRFLDNPESYLQGL